MINKKAERRMNKRIANAQFHHITYEPERIVPVFRGEHYILSLMQRLTFNSSGFLEGMQFEIARIKDRPIIILNSEEIINLRSIRKRKKLHARKQKAANKTLLEKRKPSGNHSSSKTKTTGV